MEGHAERPIGLARSGTFNPVPVAAVAPGTRSRRLNELASRTVATNEVTPASAVLIAAMRTLVRGGSNWCAAVWRQSLGPRDDQPDAALDVPMAYPASDTGVDTAPSRSAGGARRAPAAAAFPLSGGSTFRGGTSDGRPHGTGGPPVSCQPRLLGLLHGFADARAERHSASAADLVAAQTDAGAADTEVTDEVGEVDDARGGRSIDTYRAQASSLYRRAAAFLSLATTLLEPWVGATFGGSACWRCWQSPFSHWDGVR
ncbi:MAG: hypothetical protein QOE07_2766, partial [Acidimicrobiaceae bacterium]|nr:hypothetical protein [Acidimicrobiaceae bacterium]